MTILVKEYTHKLWAESHTKTKGNIGFDGNRNFFDL